jgi:hypothetical protein
MALLPYFLSILALGVGPALARVAGRLPTLPTVVDGFVLVSVAGLVALHVLPHSVELAGPWALGAAAVGLGFPALAERTPLERRRPYAFVLWGAGIVVHAFLDGTVLLVPEHAPTTAVALAAGVVLHRIPVGMTIWWLVRPRLGTRAALGVAGLLALGSLAGVVIGPRFVAGLAASSLGFFQAFVAGNLVHILLHPFSSKGTHGEATAGAERQGRSFVAALWGSAIGAALVGAFYWLERS